MPNTARRRRRGEQFEADERGPYLSATLEIQPWALSSLPWARRHYEEGDNRCTCMLCEQVIGAGEKDPRWKNHDSDCTGCSVCEIAIRIWRGEGKNCQEQRYHVDCFAKVCRPKPALGPAEAS